MRDQNTANFAPDGMSGNRAQHGRMEATRNEAGESAGRSMAAEFVCRYHDDGDAYDDGLVHSHDWAVSEDR